MVYLIGEPLWNEFEMVSDPTRKNVYRISDNFVAKFNYFLSLEEQLKYFSIEYMIHDKVYRSGITSPKPLGIFGIKVPQKIRFAIGRCIAPALVMEYIEGKTVWGLDDYYLSKIVKEEINKARKKGFEPVDCGDYNAIWSEKKKKVFLIDFEQWRIKNSFFIN